MIKVTVVNKQHGNKKTFALNGRSFFTRHEQRQIWKLCPTGRPKKCGCFVSVEIEEPEFELKIMTDALGYAHGYVANTATGEPVFKEQI